MLIAHISDLHFARESILGGRVDTASMAERAVAALLRLSPAPDAVIVTGDLTENGVLKEYELLATLFDRLPMPVYAVPGNHDRREPFRSAFIGKRYLPEAGPLNYVVDFDDLRLIGLDTLVEYAGHGALGENSLDFLESRLRERPQVPTLLFTHHPPITCGIVAMDQIRLIDGAHELANIVQRFPHVQRLLAGHVHRSIQARFAGTLCQIAPSVAHQVAADFSGAEALNLILEPPGFLLHKLDAGEFSTHLVYVDEGAHLNGA